MSEQKNNKTFQFNRGTWFYLILSFIGAFWAVYYYNAVPSFTDAYYHMNGAVSIADGEGFVDNYLWTYVGAPDSLPAPSHLYWMPGTSIIASTGMFIFGTSYSAAQIGLAFCLWGAMILAYWLGLHYGGSARHAWMAGLLTLFSGFFTDMWGQTDTFAPYAFFGAGALIFMALGISSEKHNLRYWILAGAFSAFGHLVRSDGLLLLPVGWSVLIWFFNRERYRQRLIWMIPFTLAYLLVMSPWFARNLNEIGRILPTGGTQNAYFTTYDELFNYPPDASLDNLLANNGEALIQTRSRALFSRNAIPLQAPGYQGAIVFFPFIFAGLWSRRKDPFIRPFWIFAIGIHLAFALVFPDAGIRGGFWHATAALVPIWAVIGLLGLDDFIMWISSFRRTWNPKLAQPILSTGMLLMVIVLTLQISSRSLIDDNRLALNLQDVIEPDSRVMLNDPSQLYYYTGISAVTIPNENPEIALEIAIVYDIDYLLLVDNHITIPMLFDETPDIALEIATVYDIDYLLLVDNHITIPMLFDETPDFLIPIEFEIDGARLYAFDRD